MSFVTVDEFREAVVRFGANKLIPGTDYCKQYFEWFQCLRLGVKVVVEIGVQGGGSLRLWKEFFPNARVFGIDSNKRCLRHQEDRIKVFIGDQVDREFLTGVAEEIGEELDVVVDDGGHRMHQQQISLLTLFPFLRCGGTYIIEDLHTSYVEKFGGGYLREGTTVEFLKSLLDTINSQYDKVEGLSSLSFHKSICFLGKKPEVRVKKLPKYTNRRDLFDSFGYVMNELDKAKTSEFSFVQVGAFDGRVGDPLNHRIVKYGWKGLLIEPNPSSYESLLRTYSGCNGLVFERCAVFESEGVVKLRIPGGRGKLASVVTTRHLMNERLCEFDVQCYTLDQLFDRNRIVAVDLLQVDAEGADEIVIRSLDFSVTKPRIVRFEHRHLGRRGWRSCIKFLNENGYICFMDNKMDTVAYLESDLELMTVVCTFVGKVL